jgi:glutamine cyclotransferase
MQEWWCVAIATSKFIFVSLLIFATLAAGQTSHKSAPEYAFEIVQTYPHDSSAFTQGLVYQNGYFYEGTGLRGQSSLRQVRIETGEIVRKTDLAPEYFGEGIAILGDKVFELTWQSHVGFVYALNDFRFLRQFSYSGEGWGLTTDGRELFMSDGTSEIRVLDPNTFAVKRRIKVRDGITPVTQLNELEFVDGEIFANVWQSNRIARISPHTGEIVGWIDLTGLLSPIYRVAEGGVLNGIAYDAQKKRLFVTGKLWPKVFEIRLQPKMKIGK